MQIAQERNKLKGFSKAGSFEVFSKLSVKCRLLHLFAYFKLNVPQKMIANFKTEHASYEQGVKVHSLAKASKYDGKRFHIMIYYDIIRYIAIFGGDALKIEYE